MGPVPRLVGSRIGVEGVVSRFFQDFARFEPLGHVPAELLELFPRKPPLTPSLHEALEGIAQHHGKIRPRAPGDGLPHLPGRRQPPPEIAPVLVRATVTAGQGKLVQQVPLVDRVDFNAIEAALPGDEGAGAEGVDEACHLVDIELPAEDGRVPVVGYGRRGHRARDQGRGGYPAESHGELEENSAVEGVDPFRELQGPEAKVGGIHQGGGLGGHGEGLDVVFHLHRPRDEEPRPSPGALHEELHRPLLEPPLGSREPRESHGGHGNAVF
ncbi:MAG: hypothetical protein BWY88_00767 [Synergistetes bacterium ADurb.Bin520]|nr:MAG: hypothetical protein BWY88_00767 [Synergistetes bacterium ADurb.Bin520]